MANKSIVMSKLRRLLQLHYQGKSKLFISNYLDLSRNTIDKYLTQLKFLNEPIEELLQLNDIGLEELFVKKPVKAPSQKMKNLHEFFPYMDKQLKKTGVTKLMMWKEYLRKHPDGFMSSQFCEYSNRWAKRSNPVMHINHKAGDKLFVDYAGKTLKIVDKQSGEVTDVQFFVAVLGASQYTYAEASLSQVKEDFVRSVENALHYYNGVPAVIVPDNLKSAVTKSNRYEPTLNEAFLDFAEHYNTTVLPARAYKPRDKSLAEGVVKILCTRIYSVINRSVFYSLKELNNAIWIELEKHNSIKFSGRSYSRKDLFDEVEQQELSPLPLTRYQIKQQSFVTVMQNGHVYLGADKHYYRVPYQYIRKKVKILYSSSQVEVYYKYTRIAIHKRIKRPYCYTTMPDYMASTHKFITEWTPQRFINWGNSIDDSVKQFIINILDKKQHPEQAYKSCMGVLSLEKKVGKERLINACKRALEYNIYNYKIVKNILERGLDNQQDTNESSDHLPEHNNIRGNNYYQ